MNKIGSIVPEKFDVFTFFMQPIFLLEKQDYVVQQLPIASHIFVESEYFYNKL